MTIRAMTLEDYDRVYALWLSCRGMGLNNLDDSREGVGRFLRRNPDTCFVAEEDGGIIGCILAGSDGRRGYIYHTAVRPDRQRQGVGSRLVDTALQALDKLQIHKVALVVFARNDAGNRFWEKQGFIARDDIVYRNRALTELIRMDT